MEEKKFINHPYIKENTIEQRLYQETITANCVEQNSLVILPTGLGKTLIAGMVTAFRLQILNEAFVIFLAPTRPLVLQHAETFKSILNVKDEEIIVFTGEAPPEERVKSWRKAKVVLATPQIMENDIITGRVDLKNCTLLILDEVHRAVGNYSYVFVAEQYLKCANKPLILGLTASPGAQRKKIEEICKNLNIRNIEIRTEKSPEVLPYVKEIKMDWVLVNLPPSILEIKKILENALVLRLKSLKEKGFIESYDIRKISRKSLIQIQNQLAKERQNQPEVFESMAKVAASIRLTHAIELIETQGLEALQNFFYKLEERSKITGSPKGLKDLLMDNEITTARIKIVNLIEKQLRHPKIEKMLQIIRQQLLEKIDSRIIVFTQYRDSASKINEILQEEGYPVERFVGQANKIGDKGLSQKQQAEIIEKFKQGIYNILVATSVAEEGLDISECDLVVFYDAVPSAIRYIQRKGRTGRKRPGRVALLLTKGTRDEAYYWSAKKKEREMKSTIKTMASTKMEPVKEDKQQIKLEKYLEEKEEEKIVVYVDNREIGSDVVRGLTRLNVKIVPMQLQVADYLASDSVAIERKTVEDFLQSIVDKRLFPQVKEITSKYERPILIIEGQDLYGKRAIHPEAIRGALISIAVDFKLPIIWAMNSQETARMIYTIARREQTERETRIYVAEKTPGDLREVQERILTGFPGINQTLAQRMLSAFKTLEIIFSIGEEELSEVKGLGKKKAEKIRKIITSKYDENNPSY
ncbi:MAG: DEAD/DEAH box helicase [Candidatus Jordarchaeum sp.]|uniref:DEAD/DEAH box helicase n=1 Tax=Candidatus Jordarchaeum sp. TaxID=2823881 RepID=UPI00404AECA3